jgi:hypothetical protein
MAGTRIDSSTGLLGLTEDPAYRRRSTLERNLQAAGGFGAVVFFVALLVNGDAHGGPAWLVWPAFAAMAASAVGTLLVRLRRHRTKPGADSSETTGD